MKLTVCLLFLATVAMALPTPDDFIGITTDSEEWWYCVDQAPFQQVVWYLVLYHPTQAVASVSASLLIETDVGYFGEWQVDAGWSNQTDLPDLDLTPLFDPEPGASHLLAHLPIVITADTQPVLLYIDPREGDDSPWYSANGSGIVPLFQYSPEYPDAYINPDSGCHYPPANESLTWSSIKSIYH